MSAVDEKLILDEAAAITTSRVSTNIIDLGAMDEPGRGQAKYVNILLETGFNTSANTLKVDIITDAAVPDAADGIMTIVPATAASALMETGKTLCKVPLPALGIKRYLGLSYVASAALVGGKVTSWISLI